MKRLYKYIWSCFSNIPEILVLGINRGLEGIYWLQIDGIFICIHFPKFSQPPLTGYQVNLPHLTLLFSVLIYT